MKKTIKIIGAGLAGCEAALQLADKNWKVKLFEMRPQKNTPAHETENFAELVCSNSLKSMLETTSSGMLKAEMGLLGCKLLKIAEKNRVPAGNALAVNRDKFSESITDLIKYHPNIEVINEEVTELDEELTIVASGPLTSEPLAEHLRQIIGPKQLYIFDAIAPIVDKESLDMDIIYEKTRYDNGDPDYLNCPFEKEEYLRFVKALNEGKKHEAKEFENEFFQELKFKFFESCIPIEELARRQEDTLRYGVMRPVGLRYPNSEKRPYAVIQLRTENKNKSAYNLVGCQTMLTYKAQKKIFRLIPGMKNAEFLRLGSIHRNSFLNAPEIFNQNLSLKNKPNIFIEGQLSGV
ncbi:MAG: methylenetetrahydrofolate--tRNA-(uracil(54)-C(5))-methyltransferase (FADH(2)-oxidizing) TrmFO, partial [Candidatus Cloacimonadota bacterium]|nr:methylenetetrahydrofolate--tRNA-(uracil(54)-C(5))-methyltransferase (FADH(2)-oxidizing) TrmFO [Candidatus Cloacimonadota bacterium]